jgi:MFS family permease
MVRRLAAGRVHYAWVVAGITFLALLGSAGFRATPGVLIVPLEQEFGWSPATISLAVSINLILFGLTGPFAAALMERFGIRPVMSAALAMIAAGSAMTVLMRAPWQLDLVWGVVVGLGTGSMASVLGAMVANRWFVARRGLVVGILTAAGATGQLIFLPTLAWLAVTAGWRWAALTVTGAALLVLPIVALFMRSRPADIGMRPYGASGAVAGGGPAGSPIATAFRGLSLGVRRREFWLLAASFFICGLSTNGLIGTHLIPASVDRGIPEVRAASLLAVIGVFDIAGTMASGWLTDRYDSRRLLFMYYGLRGLSLLFLPFAYSAGWLGLVPFIVFYGLDWVATVPPTVALTAETFGRDRMSIVYGWIFASHQLGAATAAFGAGAIRTWLHDYELAFLSAGLLCLIAAMLSMSIARRGPSPAPAPAPAAA